MNKKIIIGAMLSIGLTLTSCGNNYRIEDNYTYLGNLTYEAILDIKKDYLELNNISCNDPFNDVNFSSYYGTYRLDDSIGYIFSLKIADITTNNPINLELGEYDLIFNDGLEPYLYYEGDLITLSAAYSSKLINDDVLSSIELFINYYEEYHS